jgi:phosphoserine phosphatase
MTTLPSWLEPFSPAFQQAVVHAVEKPGTSKLACFDADGTIWTEDIGEALFRWLSAGGLLSGIDPRRDPFDVWAEYEERVRKNRSDGYAWAVQCMAGLAETDVRRWCRQMAVAWPNYRPEMVQLIGGLSKSGFEVWLVSASNAWIIEAAAPLVGAAPAHVLGIRVAVDSAKLTDRIVPPVTCGAGKVDAIAAHIGRRPDLAFGDSMGDREMLESATVPLAIGRRDRPGAELLALAASRQWATHLF